VDPDNLAERAIDIDSHSPGIPTDEDVGARLEPGEQFATLLEHTVLDIDLAVLVAAEGRVEPPQDASGGEFVQLVLVEEVASGSLVAEEEPDGMTVPGIEALLEGSWGFAPNPRILEAWPDK
jgi:hypothetical protein